MLSVYRNMVHGALLFIALLLALPSGAGGFVLCITPDWQVSITEACTAGQCCQGDVSGAQFDAGATRIPDTHACTDIPIPSGTMTDATAASAQKLKPPQNPTFLAADAWRLSDTPIRTHIPLYSPDVSSLDHPYIGTTILQI